MSDYHEVGDKIRYHYEKAEHEHVVHGVRYEEIDGRRVNLRYIVGLKFIEHGDKHKHDLRCPIIEREVRREDVIA